MEPARRKRKLDGTIRKLCRLPDGTRLTIDGGKSELVKRDGKWKLRKCGTI